MDGYYDSSSKRSHSRYDDEEPERNSPSKRRHVSDSDPPPPPLDIEYRILCPDSKIGGVIGKGGSIIKALSQDTRAKIIVEDSVSGSEERVIYVRSSSEKDRDRERDRDRDGRSRDRDRGREEMLCPAQDALIKIHARITEGEGAVSDEDDDEPPRQVTARLLVPDNQIGCVIGEGGRIIEQMRKEIGAQIRVLPKESLPPGASHNDELVQLSGDPALVRKALFAISSRLYENPPCERTSAYSQGASIMPGGSLYSSSNILSSGGSYMGFGHYGGAAWPMRTGVGAPRSDGASDDVLTVRVLCPNDKAGIIIGKGGNVIRKLREESGAKIKVGEPVSGADERIIEISSSEVKSELLETLDHQQRTVSELSSKVESLQGRASIAESERDDSLDHAKRLEQEVAASSAREKAAHEKFILELGQAEERFRLQLKRCNDLEVKFQQEMRQRAEAERKANALDGQLASLKDTSDKATQASKREVRMLKDNLTRAQKDADLNMSRTKVENSAKKGELQFVQSELQRLKVQNADLQNQLSKSLDDKRTIELKLAAVPSHHPSSENHELETIINNLRNELKHCESDVTEARKLKKFHMNVDLLKEKVESEKQRADRAEAALGDCEDLQLLVKSLKGELQSWKNLIHELPDVEKRDDIPRKISDFQREAMSATAKAGEAAAQASELKVALEMAENRRHEAEKDLSLVEEELNEMVLKNNRLERKVQLLSKERDGYKSIVASYDEEEVAIMKQSEGEKMQELTETSENAKGKRIQELEALIVTFQQETDILRSDLTKAEMKLGRGDYDPSSTKVVHLVENLDINTEKQVLLSEIQILREKLNSSQRTKANTENGNSGNVQLSLLREQVNSLEKREARYKKVFAEKISVFRQACCLLFGYTIQMNEEQHPSTGMMITLFTLQSIYAQNEDEKLEFQFELDHMNLLGNEYTTSAEIERMVDVYLQKFKSIPAFTANLTSELFNKATIS